MVFQAPEATLLNPGGASAGIHYVGPTWEGNDKSKVIGARVASHSADPSAIPLLLLRATGHEGNGRMAGVTFIQRLDTVGGIAPVSPCDHTNAGEIARVSYSASYIFYKARSGNANLPQCD